MSLGAQQDTRQEDRFFDVGPVGVEQAVSVGFDIASVRVHNPSGMWLLLPQNQQYIPPNTLGAYITVKPTTKTLRIKYVNAPINGQPSVATGGPIQITVFAAENADFTGLDYGLVNGIDNLAAAIAGLQNSIDNMVNGFGSNVLLESERVSFTVDATATTNTVFVNGIPGQRVALVNVFISFDDADPMPCIANIIIASTVIGSVVVSVSLSPETPYASIMIPKIAALVPDVGEGLSVEGSWAEDFASNLGISSMPRNFSISAWWYMT